MKKLPLMLGHVASKKVLVGMSGCGKTKLANWIIENSDYNWYFVFDPENQFAQRNGVASAMNEAQLLEQLKQHFVVFNPSEMFSDVSEAFEWFCKWVYTLSEYIAGTKLLFCDEVQDIVGCNQIGEYTRRIQMSGRNRGLDWLCCSLQYNFIHNSIRGQATETIAFAADDDLAIKALLVRGFKADELRALSPGQYISINRHTGETVRGEIDLTK